jgi:hypothetical protein
MNNCANFNGKIEKCTADRFYQIQYSFINDKKTRCFLTKDWILRKTKTLSLFCLINRLKLSDRLVTGLD